MDTQNMICSNNGSSLSNRKKPGESAFPLLELNTQHLQLKWVNKLFRCFSLSWLAQSHKRKARQNKSALVHGGEEAAQRNSTSIARGRGPEKACKVVPPWPSQSHLEVCFTNSLDSCEAKQFYNRI